MAEINQAHARRLLNRLVIEVDPKSVVLRPRRQSNEILFCGYVSLKLSLTESINGVVQSIPLVTLRNSTIQVGDRKIHFEPKREKTGEKSKSAKPYHSVWYPSTPGARAVFDAKISRSPIIKNMVEQAIRQTNNVVDRNNSL